MEKQMFPDTVPLSDGLERILSMKVRESSVILVGKRI